MEALNLREIIKDEKTLIEFINQMKQERDRFVQEANSKIAFMNGQINLLESLKETKDGLD